MSRKSASRSKAPSKAASKKPTTVAAPTTLAARVQAYVKLFSQRADVRVAASSQKRGARRARFVEGTPDDLQAFAAELGALTWTWTLHDDPPARSSEPISRGGGLALELTNLGDFDDEDGEGGSSVVFDAPTAEGTARLVSKRGGLAVEFSYGGKATAFPSFEAYVTTGARCAFTWYWQQGVAQGKQLLAELRANSLPKTTARAELVALFGTRGVDRGMAESLCDWLGPDAVLLHERPGVTRASTGTAPPAPTSGKANRTLTLRFVVDGGDGSTPVASSDRLLRWGMGLVVALDPASGIERWRWEVGAATLKHTPGSIQNVFVIGPHVAVLQHESEASVMLTWLEGKRVVQKLELYKPSANVYVRGATSSEDLVVLLTDERIAAYRASAKQPVYKLACADGSGLVGGPGWFVVEHGYDRFSVHTTKTGKLAWQGEGNVRAGDRTRIVVHHEARLHALSAATGKPQWHSPLALSDDHAFGVALTADAVFVANTTTGQVHCLEAATGTVRWTIKQKCANTSLLVHAGLVWLIDHANRLTAIAPADGRVVSTAPSKHAAAALAGGDGWIAVEAREGYLGKVECYDVPASLS